MIRKVVDNDVYEVTQAFALRVVNMYKYLQDTQKEYIISKQIFRSGTNIGANVREARNAQSRADFSNKMNIALKEADETAYWLELLHKAEFIDDEMFCSIYDDCDKIIGILTKIVKSTKTC